MTEYTENTPNTRGVEMAIRPTPEGVADIVNRLRKSLEDDRMAELEQGKDGQLEQGSN